MKIKGSIPLKHTIVIDTIERWFTDNIEFSIFILIAVIGIVSSLSTFNLLDGYKFNSGKNLAGVFAPLFYPSFTLQ